MKWNGCTKDGLSDKEVFEMDMFRKINIDEIWEFDGDVFGVFWVAKAG